MVVPLLLVEEKEKRTLDFLLASPASLKEIVAGKALTGVAYTVLIAGLLLFVNRQLSRKLAVDGALDPAGTWSLLSQ